MTAQNRRDHGLALSDRPEIAERTAARDRGAGLGGETGVRAVRKPAEGVWWVSETARR